MDKLIKASSVLKIVARLSMEAASSWDIDAVVICGKIIKEIEALPGEDYAADTQTQKDQL